MCSPDRRDYPLAVVEAKANYRQPTEGMRAAEGLCPVLEVYFAYAQSGKRIIEFHFTAGQELL